MASKGGIQSVILNGLSSANDKLHQVSNDITGRPMESAYNQSVEMLVRDAKLNAPVDTGGLRNSITGQVFTRNNTLVGVAGSPLKHAPFQEYGTGTLAGNAPHRPSAASLIQWASRHRANPYAVARSIALRGGLKPKKFFQNTYDNNRDRIIRLIQSTTTDIVRK